MRPKRILLPAMCLALAVPVLTILPCFAHVEPTYQFYASQGYYNGANVYYLMTDVSDLAYAETFDVNYTPLLGNAMACNYLPDAYFVTNRVQGLVFTAQPPGKYTPGSYMPLWVLNIVTWYPGKTSSTLTSKSAIDTVRKAGKVRVSRLRVVVGASIIINSSGAAMRQASVRVMGARRLVTVPLGGMYVDGEGYGVLRLDFSSNAEAGRFGGNNAPLMAQLNIIRVKMLPVPWQVIYSLWTIPPLHQLDVGSEVPTELGPHNANPDYSPVMFQLGVKTTGPSTTPFTSVKEITDAGLDTWNLNMISYRPVWWPPPPPPPPP